MTATTNNIADDFRKLMKIVPIVLRNVWGKRFKTTNHIY